ncbi:DUF1254 domain-containing protein [Pinibacter aurantiacus]|uniref:DUF1254 domain-containing protein n=1 Tax=Pinibacter aurantiacus TaxID=2851599 RepID=A0A9E2W3R0_9BACT|nr:DUF1254 domain-containing protein [Pinibacter aurantiacus]MBV4358830.1 DUF1254 domain-containing protein [Pinibacter aurantiacus]
MYRKIFFAVLGITMIACNQSPTQQKKEAKENADTLTTTSFIPANIKEQMIYQRALQAVIWGMPAVNYDLMLQEMLAKTAGKQNEIVYWSRPVDWHNQTLTPNPDAIYFMVFFNTKDAGPVVISVPPADGVSSFAGNIDNVFQMPLEDAGPYGADKGAGGKYLILPPGYQQKPPSGYIVLAADTYEGYALLRSNLPSHSDADVAKAVNYGKRLKVYPLSKAGNPGETKFTDASDVLYDATIQYDVKFFRSLDRIVQSQPWLTRDKGMIDLLKTIGIEKGKQFNPDTKTTDILNAAAKAARDYIEVMYDAGFPPLNSDAHWAVPAMPELVKAGSSGYTETNIYPVDARSLTYAIGYVGIKRLGTAQIYLIAGKDKDGNALSGAEIYRLHVPANVPTKQYWSATVYDRQTHALIRNLSRASCASNDKTVQKNSDGSVDVYFAPQSPAGKQSNWVPTDSKGQFEVLFRLYGPEKALFEKNWKLGDIEKVK